MKIIKKMFLLSLLGLSFNNSFSSSKKKPLTVSEVNRLEILRAKGSSLTPKEKSQLWDLSGRDLRSYAEIIAAEGCSDATRTDSGEADMSGIWNPTVSNRASELKRPGKIKAQSKGPDHIGACQGGY